MDAACSSSDRSNMSASSIGTGGAGGSRAGSMYPCGNFPPLFVNAVSLSWVHAWYCRTACSCSLKCQVEIRHYPIIHQDLTQSDCACIVAWLHRTNQDWAPYTTWARCIPCRGWFYDSDISQIQHERAKTDRFQCDLEFV
jgi:hypothetical protein